MFDSFSDLELVTEMSAAQRDERVAVARRILAAGGLCQRRTAGMRDDERISWCIDNWEATAAEVGAALGVSRARASSQMNYGVELLQRLPRLAAQFAAGDVEFRVIAACVFRTGAVTGPGVNARLDEVFARRAWRWNRLSRVRLAEAIDQWVSHLDPAALRRAQRAEESRGVEFGEPHEGMVAFWGSLRTAEAAVVSRRLDELAAAAPSETGTATQRRADALVALAAGGIPGESSPVVITVLAEAATLAGESEKPGYLAGYGPVPPALVRAMADRATLRPLTPPALLCAEPRYRPSRALAEFIRCRDLGCRFPGCDKPAEVCDIDHTIPYADGGPTHPSNLALLCRGHHLLKTFWDGENGWRQKQFPDGTIEWISPSGQVHVSTPAGAEFFPQLAEPAEEITVDIRKPRARACRTLRMPARQRPRAAERAARIAWERALNEARWAADPPPF